jgi:hypothetical protein
MFLKKVKWKNTTYYYLMRRAPGDGRQEQLTSLGSIEDASPYKEEELVKTWITTLLVGGEQSHQAALELRKDISKSRLKEFGRSFDLQKCIEEFRAVHKKYGHLSKQLLEKQARPNGDLSWGTSTILNQLRNRGMTLAQTFEVARQP